MSCKDLFKKYNVDWSTTHKRIGDKNDEYLIGELEYKFARKITLDSLNHFLLNFRNVSLSPLKKTISTLNAKRLNKTEILRIINSRYI